MSYKDTLNIIEGVAKEFQKIALNNPMALLNRKGKLKKNELCVSICKKVNKMLKKPWLSEDEIKNLFDQEIETKKSATKNAFYEIGENRIYSTIKHQGYYFDGDGNMYMLFVLDHKGCTGPYNPYIKIKFNIIGGFIALKLEDHTIKVEADDLCRDTIREIPDDSDRVYFDVSGEN